MLVFERCDLITELLYLDLMLVISFINVAHCFLRNFKVLVRNRLRLFFTHFLLNSMKHSFDSFTLILLFCANLLLNNCGVFCPAIGTVIT